MHESAQSRWTAEAVAAIDDASSPEIPIVAAEQIAPIISGIDVWDAWPLTDRDGRIAAPDGHEYWMMLSAAMTANPAERHDHARIRLVERVGDTWRDHGNLLPDGLCSGTREWAGSAVFDPTTGSVTLFFTATGRRGAPFSFEQRLFQTTGRLDRQGDVARVEDWSNATEVAVSDGDVYVDTRTTQGGPGLIKGFRDPAYFRDPLDGAEYITFVGSDGRSTHTHNGVIGIARHGGGSWALLPPILSADGLCNELERPHLLYQDRRYYLFWSTQRLVFAPGGPSGPNGLYGAVADHVLGPYRPLNGTGLVAANPQAEPFQTYSWLVLDTLEVTAFVDYWGMGGRTLTEAPHLARTQFGGLPAPRFRIAIDGDASRLT